MEDTSLEQEGFDRKDNEASSPGKRNLIRKVGKYAGKIKDSFNKGKSESNLARARVTRRGLLAGVALAGASILLGKKISQAEETNPFPQIPAGYFDTEESNVAASHSKKAESSTVPEKYKLFKEKGHYSEEELRTLDEMVQKQVERYSNKEETEKRKQDTLRWKENLNTVLIHGKVNDNPLTELILPLIYVESSGIVNPSNPLASGLCQLKPSSAKEILEKLQKTPDFADILKRLKFEDEAGINPDLKDPKTNIALTVEYLKKLWQIFPDPGIALWAYHFGEMNMVRAIKRYTVSKGKSIGYVDKLLEDPARPGSAVLIKEEGLNFIKLMSSPSTQQLIKEYSLGDDTQYYVPRILAAQILLKG